MGGRKVATFRLSGGGIPCGDGRFVGAFEIPSPKEGRLYRTGMEHVEFVVDKDQGDGTTAAVGSPLNDGGQHRPALEAFMGRHPAVRWDVRALEKNINPNVSTSFKLEGFGICSAKFHLLSLSEVIKFEKGRRGG